MEMWNREQHPSPPQHRRVCGNGSSVTLRYFLSLAYYSRVRQRSKSWFPSWRFFFPSLLLCFCFFFFFLYYKAEGFWCLSWCFIGTCSGFGICLLSQCGTVDFQPVKESEILKHAIHTFNSQIGLLSSL